MITSSFENKKWAKQARRTVTLRRGKANFIKKLLCGIRQEVKWLHMAHISQSFNAPVTLAFSLLCPLEGKKQRPDTTQTKEGEGTESEPRHGAAGKTGYPCWEASQEGRRGAPVQGKVRVPLACVNLGCLRNCWGFVHSSDQLLLSDLLLLEIP